MTLVFNLLLAARPTKAWLIWFLLGNCFVPFGIRYFDGMRDFSSPQQLVEFAIENESATKSAITVAYGEGWSQQQWWPDTTWRWAQSGRATVIFRNNEPQPVRVEIRFLAHSLATRPFEISAGERILYDEALPAGQRVITLQELDLAPGETRVTFLASGPTTKSDDFTPGEVVFKMETPRVKIVSPSK